MPDAGRSFYVNSAADPKAKFEDFIIKDLIPYVDSHFRSIPLPRARAVAGLSMGGYGAAFLGLKHYRRFAAIGSFSGAVGIARDATAANPANAEAERRTKELQGLFGPAGSPDRAARDPFALLEKVPPAEMPTDLHRLRRPGFPGGAEPRLRAVAGAEEDPLRIPRGFPARA